MIFEEWAKSLSAEDQIIFDVIIGGQHMRIKETSMNKQTYR